MQHTTRKKLLALLLALVMLVGLLPTMALPALAATPTLTFQYDPSSVRIG